jgi:hypothetical protein
MTWNENRGYFFFNQRWLINDASGFQWVTLASLVLEFKRKYLTQGQDNIIFWVAVLHLYVHSLITVHICSSYSNRMVSHSANRYFWHDQKSVRKQFYMDQNYSMDSVRLVFVHITTTLERPVFTDHISSPGPKKTRPQA